MGVPRFKHWLPPLFLALVLVSLTAGYVLRDIGNGSVVFPEWVGTITLQLLPA
jgi:hypothetical protein